MFDQAIDRVSIETGENELLTSGPRSTSRRARAATDVGSRTLIRHGQLTTNPVHADDDAEATVLALENHERIAGEILNVCDDERVTLRQIIELIAEKVETKRPRNVPKWLANVLLGSRVVRPLTASVRVRNRKAKEALGFQPTFRTFREGWCDDLEKWLHSRSGGRA